ncbi:hypothetical protein DL93DRAFT_505865 [Clavulina sp. PMI_390]|nr:hypothetical protein DL93DRAFT_505865 [Clavulina sp. PMI_390]
MSPVEFRWSRVVLGLFLGANQVGFSKCLASEAFLNETIWAKLAILIVGFRIRGATSPGAIEVHHWMVIYSFNSKEQREAVIEVVKEDPLFRITRRNYTGDFAVVQPIQSED